MGKALFLDSVAGVAGDMFSAAFVNAGLVSVDELNSLAGQLGLKGVRIVAEDVVRASVKATHLTVVSVTHDWKRAFTHTNGDHHHDEGHHHQTSESDNTNLLLNADHRPHHWHAHYTEIDALIAGSKLDGPVKELAQDIFRMIAEAEGEVHGQPLDKVAFHEVGTIDSIMDVVMAAHCITRTAPTRVFATPLKPGRGMIDIAHGTHPIPPPASALLLTGLTIASTPAAIVRENIELSTPTGIAIIRTLSPEFTSAMPEGVLRAHGRGAGTMDLGSYPNVFQVSMIETREAEISLPYETDTITEIACNIDDDTAEHLAWISAELLKRGALDVWQTPGTGKKGRSMICLTVLTPGETFFKLADWLLRNSTTFGLRYRSWERSKLVRAFEEREVGGRTIRFKIGSTTTGEKLKEKPEFDDLFG